MCPVPLSLGLFFMDRNEIRNEKSYACKQNNTTGCKTKEFVALLFSINANDKICLLFANIYRLAI